MNCAAFARLLFFAIVGVTVCGCSETAPPSQPTPTPPVAESVQPPAGSEVPASVARANPASEHCVQQGGRLRIEKTPKGDEYGICIFEDNYQCEEWALLREECRAGGVRVTGYITAAARYCAITGGAYAVTVDGDASTEKGKCTFREGKECDADAYFRGDCTRSR